MKTLKIKFCLLHFFDFRYFIAIRHAHISDIFSAGKTVNNSLKLFSFIYIHVYLIGFFFLAVVVLQILQIVYYYQSVENV